jgi:hypothetical protein
MENRNQGVNAMQAIPNPNAPMNMANPYPNPMAMPMYNMPPEIQLARAYVPDQPYERLFPLNEALKKGTLFPNLYQPYMQKRN